MITKYNIFEKIESNENIFDLIKRHNIEKIKNVTSEELNILDSENTPLMYAIMQSDVQIVSLLVDKTENINYQDRYNENALSVIIYAKPTKRLKILEILLKREDLDINCIYDYNLNIIMRYYYELKEPTNVEFGDDDLFKISRTYTKKEKDNNDSIYDMIILLIKKGVDITHRSYDISFMELIKDDKYLINRIKTECPEKYTYYKHINKSRKFNL